MRKILFLALFFNSALICLHAQTSKGDEQAAVKATPVSLVEQQVNGYNARNIDSFLAPYADSVEMYDFPNKFLGKGKEGMRRGYTDFFKKTPDLHCEITSRIVQGNTVIDKERVTGMG